MKIDDCDCDCDEKILQKSCKKLEIMTNFYVCTLMFQSSSLRKSESIFS